MALSLTIGLTVRDSLPCSAPHDFLELTPLRTARQYLQLGNSQQDAQYRCAASP